MKLTANAEEAAKQAGIEFEIEKVTEINKIMNYGVMMTPAPLRHDPERFLSRGDPDLFPFGKIQISENIVGD